MTLGVSGPRFSFVDEIAEPKQGPAQTYSLLIHALALCALFASLIARRPMPPTVFSPESFPHHIVFAPSPTTFGVVGAGNRGGGGEQDPRPATHGELPPRSVMPLAPPRIPIEHETALPVPPAVFDANAPDAVKAVNQLGLPWMKNDTNSAGPGKGHGIGTGNDGGIGDDDGGGEAYGGNGVGNAAATMPTCQYCPTPAYTDDARRAKVQGTVTLRVLVGADGRAHRIEIVKGLEASLDAKALEVLRTWRFGPALDTSRKAVPVWVTIETKFRLF
jgi:periplasmic protein TonB